MYKCFFVYEGFIRPAVSPTGWLEILQIILT